jgi:hypothetical protein
MKMWECHHMSVITILSLCESYHYIITAKSYHYIVTMRVLQLYYHCRVLSQYCHCVSLSTILSLHESWPWKGQLSFWMMCSGSWLERRVIALKRAAGFWLVCGRSWLGQQLVTRDVRRVGNVSMYWLLSCQLVAILGWVMRGGSVLNLATAGWLPL